MTNNRVLLKGLSRLFKEHGSPLPEQIAKDFYDALVSEGGSKEQLREQILRGETDFEWFKTHLIDTLKEAYASLTDDEAGCQ